jgi:hypothetical protein
MSFVRLLGMANFVPEQVDSKSEIVIDKDSDVLSITSVHLTVTEDTGIDQAAFQSCVAVIESLRSPGSVESNREPENEPEDLEDP